jgi:dTDP-4-dehydrorhamnose 3,5-epimerase
MRFTELSVAGTYLLELEPQEDERGSFARCFSEEEFAKQGLATRFPHSNLSRNRQAGTLRGMHYTVPPSDEAKVVRCVMGAIYDVAVDVRAGSPSFGRWVQAELTAENGRAIYIPAGFAHGFLSLVDATDVLYLMGDVYRPETGRGFRWNDRMFSIEWPFEPRVISARDAGYPDFRSEPK